MRDEAAVKAAVDASHRALRAHGRAVNAAGVVGFGSAHTLEVEEFERVVDINLKGSFIVSKHVLPKMLEQGSGSIIHIASVEGLVGISGQLAYNASKGGVVLMTKNMALDYSPARDPRQLHLPGRRGDAHDRHAEDGCLKAIGDKLRRPTRSGASPGPRRSRRARSSSPPTTPPS